MTLIMMMMMMMTCVVYCGFPFVIVYVVRVPTCHSPLAMRVPTCHCLYGAGSHLSLSAGYAAFHLSLSLS